MEEKKKLGRPPKATKEINPQVQFGRHPQSEIDEIDAAARAANKTRAEWAWEKLLRAARREMR
jgi:hypothetical protein